MKTCYDGRSLYAFTKAKVTFPTWNLYHDKQLSDCISAYNNLGLAWNQNFKGALKQPPSKLKLSVFGASIIANTIPAGRERQTHAWFMLLEGRLQTGIQEGMKRATQMPFRCFPCPCSRAPLSATWTPTNRLDFQSVHAQCSNVAVLGHHCHQIVCLPLACLSPCPAFWYKHKQPTLASFSSSATEIIHILLWVGEMQTGKHYHVMVLAS